MAKSVYLMSDFFSSHYSTQNHLSVHCTHSLTLSFVYVFLYLVLFSLCGTNQSTPGHTDRCKLSAPNLRREYGSRQRWQRQTTTCNICDSSMIKSDSFLLHHFLPLRSLSVRMWRCVMVFFFGVARTLDRQAVFDGRYDTLVWLQQ